LELNNQPVTTKNKKNKNKKKTKNKTKTKTKGLLDKGAPNY